MSGFQNASVTKGMMILLGVSSLTVSLLDIKPYFHLQLVPHMTKYHQFWRLLVHPFVFTNSTELLIGELLLYNVGVHIERSFGPRKYASFVLLSSILSTILSFVGIVLFHAFGLPSIPAGPYGVIFSLLWQHHRVVPSLYSFRVLGTEYSNKVFQWILALQLFTSSPPTSMLASLSGLAAGYLYRTDTLLLPSSLRHRRILKPLKAFRIPISIYNLLQRLFHPLIGTSPPPRRNLRALPGQINEATALRAQRMATASQLAGPTFSSLLAARMNPGAAANPSVTRRVPAAGLAANRVPGAAATPRPAPPAETARPAAATGARAAMGEWVSEMTGGNGVRAPTEQEIIALTSIFPNLSRERIISALQRSNYNTALAVEALIQEAS